MIPAWVHPAHVLVGILIGAVAVLLWWAAALERRRWRAPQDVRVEWFWSDAAIARRQRIADLKTRAATVRPFGIGDQR